MDERAERAWVEFGMEEDDLQRIVSRAASNASLPALHLRKRQHGHSQAVVLQVTDGEHDYVLKIARRKDADAIEKLRLEATQLRACAPLLMHVKTSLRLPKVVAEIELDDWTGFFATWLEGTPFGMRIASGTCDATEFRESLRGLFASLSPIYAAFNRPAPPGFARAEYVTRPLRRLESARAQLLAWGEADAARIFDAECIFVNGERYVSPIRIVEILSSNIDDSALAPNMLFPCVSGDLQFDNILVHPGAATSLVDPRGACDYTLWNDLSVPVFDPMFDFAKLCLFLSGWKQIELGRFRLKLTRSGSALLFYEGTLEARFDLFRRIVLELLGNALTVHGFFNTSERWVALLKITALHFFADCDSRLKYAGRGGVTQVIAELLMGTVLWSRAMSLPTKCGWEDVARALEWVAVTQGSSSAWSS